MIMTKLTNEFMQKVYKFCREVSATEWSGILFYKTKDRSLPIDQWEIDVIDFFPMATGIVTFTSFDVEVDHIVYADANGLDFNEVQMGLIHSHNNMAVFFSGEDMSELKDNAGKFDAYLSLIVNNKGEVCAKVAQQVEVVYNYKSKNFKGSPHTFSKNGEKTLYTVDCQIVYPDLGINADWLTRFEEVKNKKYERPTPTTITTPYISNSTTVSGKQYWDNIDAWSKTTTGKQGTFNFSTPKKNSKPTPTEFQKFVMDEILDCMEDLPLETAVMNYEAGYFDTEMFIDAYDNFFGKTSADEELRVVEEVITLLQPYVNRNKDLREVIKDCQNYLKQANG